MQISKTIKRFRNSKQKYLVTCILLIVVVILGFSSYKKGRGRTKLDYQSSLASVAVCVQGEEFTLRQLAFYVAYEEEQVEKQALIYSPDNPKSYWNVYTNHTYIRNAARNAAIQMAIHDAYFYHMALEQNVELEDEEKAVLHENVTDFWYDLTDDGKEKRLGIEKSDIENTMTRIAYAQKMQLIYANLNNLENEDYDFTGDAYLQILPAISYQVEDVWGRVDFGNVTLNHS